MCDNIHEVKIVLLLIIRVLKVVQFSHSVVSDSL